MFLKEVIKVVHGKGIGNIDVKISQVSTDTRTLQSGDLFIPLIGNNYNGHDFLLQACDRGAAAVLANESEWNKRSSKKISIPVVLVKDSLQALQQLAANHRNRYNIPVIAITGSVGKTTTKDMVASVLRSNYKVLKSQGSFNNEIGLPLTMLQIDEHTQAVVVELGMRGIGQIAALAEIARPTIGVITNIAPVHLELLGSMDAIAAAKGELIRHIDENGLAVLNAQDDYTAAMEKWTRAKVKRFGFCSKEDYYADAIHLYFNKSKFCLHIGNKDIPIEMGIPGKHNVLNAVAAAGIGYELGLSMEEIAKGLNQVELSEKRLEMRKIKGKITIVNDAYNANPVSMAASLEILSMAKTGKRIAVLGDMYELGSDETEFHYQLGKKICGYGLDRVVVIGKLASFIAKGALECGMDMEHVFVCATQEEAFETIKSIIGEGDVILFKGSRGVYLENLVDRILKEDREQ